jgi:hypothetical protein
MWPSLIPQRKEDNWTNLIFVLNLFCTKMHFLATEECIVFQIKRFQALFSQFTSKNLHIFGIIISFTHHMTINLDT